MCKKNYLKLKKDLKREGRKQLKQERIYYNKYRNY